MKTTISLLFMLFLISCEKDVIVAERSFEEFVTPIPESEQRVIGDATKGLEYLIYGDYISSGFPFDFFVQNFPDTSSNALLRTGKASQLPYAFNAVKADNGVDIVAPNCFQCHAQYLNGELILGLGNYDSDYTFDQTFTIAFSQDAIRNQYGEESLEWQAFDQFRKASLVTSPYLVAEVKGVNPADKLTAVLAAHRNPQTFEWLDEAQYEIPPSLVPTDVPALWLMKKKNALYYTASGRGDFARLITLAEILTLPDTAKAREIDEKFTDVYSFLENLEAPRYPSEIDEEAATKGMELFQEHCAKCHGTSNYPNLLVDLEYIGTDPELANANFAYQDFLDWYNGSWYSKGRNSAYFETTNGYIAPPLDGVWATAPYLHNGSVPDMESLLNSSARPDFWKRGKEYNFDKLGWDYNVFNAGAGSVIYDTSKKGYSNKGHIFGDVLNIEERKQVIEFLKTL